MIHIGKTAAVTKGKTELVPATDIDRSQIDGTYLFTQDESSIWATPSLLREWLKIIEEKE